MKIETETETEIETNESLHHTILTETSKMIEDKVNSLHDNIFNQTNNELLTKIVKLEVENNRNIQKINALDKDMEKLQSMDMQSYIDNKIEKQNNIFDKKIEIDKEINKTTIKDTIKENNLEWNTILKKNMTDSRNDIDTNIQIVNDNLLEKIKVIQKNDELNIDKINDMNKNIDKLNTLYDRVENSYQRNYALLDNVQSQLDKINSKIELMNESNNTKYDALQQCHELNIQKQENKILNETNKLIRDNLSEYHRLNQNNKIAFETLYDENQTLLNDFLNNNSVYERMVSSISSKVEERNNELMMNMKELLVDKKLKKNVEELCRSSSFSLDQILKLQKN